MGLKEYKAKRKFKNTPEPEGKVEKKESEKLRFVIQKHHASHLHYDFRLEMEGVLKSWAIPKGPSMNPADKRLAMMVEDHPIEYGSFEGIIPAGNYGAGTVMIWDEGTYEPLEKEEGEDDEKALRRGLKQGNLKFIMHGQKLNGAFALVRTKRTEKGNDWLLIKKKDDYSTDQDISAKDKSVKTKRTLDQIKEQSGKGATVWHSSRDHAEVVIPDGASKSSFPHEVAPMMASLADSAFDSNDWLFEIKWDGFRAISEINFNEVSIYSRNLLSFNERFPTVVEELESLGIQAVLDGEICAVDEIGKAEFQLIQNYQRTGKGNIIYYVFDLLYYNGYDLKEVPLIERKNLLRQIIPNGSSVIKFSDHIIGKGKDFFALAKKQNLEGIVGKKLNSSYYEGTRGKEWLKIKVVCEQEAVVAGYTKPRGGRKNFGALVLGVYEGDRLVYIGHSGGGFDLKSLLETYSKLKSLETSECPFESIPKTNMPVTWVKPQLVCQVKFQEWTNEGLMRQPIFLGLRDDKSPKEVKREISTITIDKNEKTKRSNEAKIKTKTSNVKSKTKNKENRRSSRSKRKSSEEGSQGTDGKSLKNRRAIPLRNNNEFLNEGEALVEQSKKQTELSKELLEQSHQLLSGPKKGLKNKKLLLNSHFLTDDHIDAEVTIDGEVLKFTNLKKVFWPKEGYTKQDLLEYYHSIASYILPYLKDRPESLRRNPNGHLESFFQKDMPKNTPSWIETIQIYSESVNKDINYMLCQDEAALLYMVNLGCIEINPWLSRSQALDNPDYIAIDLDPQDVPFEHVIEVAQGVKEVLDQGRIDGYCKTSGSRGLHIYIPLDAKYDYEQAKTFGEIIANLVHQKMPKITSLERSPSRRKNKIYLDYLQNRKGQTLAAPYCVRPKPGATVSTPLEWEEVKPGLDPSEFTIKTIVARLKEKGDLFNGVLSKGVDITKALNSLGIK
jgi:bifunctional non-homologous end joining protein LigD